MEKPSQVITLPSISELSKAYKKAIKDSDTKTAEILESAIMQVAIAEAASAEASVLSEFILGK